MDDILPQVAGFAFQMVRPVRLPRGRHQTDDAFADAEVVALEEGFGRHSAMDGQGVAAPAVLVQEDFSGLSLEELQHPVEDRLEQLVEIHGRAGRRGERVHQFEFFVALAQLGLTVLDVLIQPGVFDRGRGVRG